MLRLLTICIAAVLLLSTPARPEGPPRAAVADYLGEAAPSGFEPADFDFKNFPSKVEAGAGRTSVLATFRNTGLLYAETSHHWLRTQLGDNGLPAHSIDALIERVERDEFTALDDPGAFTDEVKFELRYRETVEGFDFAGKIPDPLDDSDLLRASAVPGNAYIAGYDSGDAVLARMMEQYGAAVARQRRGIAVLRRVRKFLDGGVREVIRRDGAIDQTNFEADCGDFASDTSDHTREETFDYYLMSCEAYFHSALEVSDIRVAAGETRAMRLSLRHGPGTDDVSLTVELEGAGGGRCDAGEWCSRTGHSMSSGYVWTGSRFYFDPFVERDYSYFIEPTDDGAAGASAARAEDAAEPAPDPGVTATFENPLDALTDESDEGADSEAPAAREESSAGSAPAGAGEAAGGEEPVEKSAGGDGPRTGDVPARYPDLFAALGDMEIGSTAVKSAATEAVAAALIMLEDIDASAVELEETLGSDAAAFAARIKSDPAAALRLSAAEAGTDVAVSLAADAVAGEVAAVMFDTPALDDVPEIWTRPLRRIVEATIVEGIGLWRSAQNPTPLALVGPVIDRVHDGIEIYRASNAVADTQTRSLYQTAISAELFADLLVDVGTEAARAHVTEGVRATASRLPDMVGRDDAGEVAQIYEHALHALVAQRRGDRAAARGRVAAMRRIGAAEEGPFLLSAEGPVDLLTKLAAGADAPKQAAQIMVSATSLSDLGAQDSPGGDIDTAPAGADGGKIAADAAPAPPTEDGEGSASRKIAMPAPPQDGQASLAGRFANACAGAPTGSLNCPYRTENACSGEGCLTSGAVRATAAVALRTRPGGRELAVRMAAGQTGLLRRRDRFSVPCRGTVQSGMPGIPPGTTVYRLGYEGEGVFAYRSQDGERAESTRDTKVGFEASCSDKYEDWIRVELEGGAKGWAPTEGFYGVSIHTPPPTPIPAWLRARLEDPDWYEVESDTAMCARRGMAAWSGELTDAVYGKALKMRYRTGARSWYYPVPDGANAQRFIEASGGRSVSGRTEIRDGGKFCSAYDGRDGEVCGRIAVCHTDAARYALVGSKTGEEMAVIEEISHSGRAREAWMASAEAKRYAGTGPIDASFEGMDFQDAQGCLTADDQAVAPCLMGKGYSEAVSAQQARLMAEQTGQAIVLDFVELGRVDFAHISLLLRANSHRRDAFANIAAADVALVPVPKPSGIEEYSDVPAVRRILARAPNAFIDRGRMRFDYFRWQPSGESQFYYTARIVDGCRACPLVGSVTMRIDVADGEIAGYQPVGWRGPDAGRFGSASLTPEGFQSNVWLVQITLNTAGYAAGPVDNVWGPKTESALRAFQFKHCLPATGEVGDATAAALVDSESLWGECFDAAAGEG